MDYPLENLDPEKFQQLCQALVAREEPTLQCFPVGQPDGGRDAISLLPEDGKKLQFAVYQVKFVRKPLADLDAHKWLLGVIEEEAPKIRRLIPKGAARFILITNVPGTAHAGSGSIDTANRTLSDGIGVLAQCWWRDDVNRRLDNAWDLKWVYPEIMTGPDFLRAIVETGLSEHRERRSSTIMAFLRHQYVLDEQVRFKQVELQNKLVDLFVDVPISIRGDTATRKVSFAFHRAVRAASPGGDDLEASGEVTEFDAIPRHYGTDHRVGGATLLLSTQTAQDLPHVVIEGAPGQGKSTITQYVCQVHRMRLLQESLDLGAIPESHRSGARRLPVRIDLRDFATWLGRANPFDPDEGQGAPAGWVKSLESFLAALISYQAGGSTFGVDDVFAVFRVSAVLLVFDGLDEVADITTRKEVVEELSRGIQRLAENCASLQTVITSRPAAFANSPGMSERRFAYLELHSLPTDLILEYAERWIRARRLDSRLAAEFRRLLKTRLDQPHLRDLARNPMQLAILLSLILTRGASLPDKRTALYDFYIDLFFSREAEKSPIVRDRRDLLIDLHGYLGWELHSEAEKGDARAAISAERLEKLVAEYLKSEGHDPGIASRLFTGVVERVVALVSRVEGTFEFEVQPLREYFAARFLFNTAPPSSPGNEKPGPRPDRFDALARNFYWLNVTRFYAGCYSKGELPSLVERLQDLCREEGYNRISDPRALTATLLADWVFAQNPRSMQQAVDLVLDDVGLRRLLADTSRTRNVRAVPGLVLPSGSGREQLTNRCFALLQSRKPPDVTMALIELLKLNSDSPFEHFEKWRTHLDDAASLESKRRWITHGLHLGHLAQCTFEDLQRFLRGVPLEERTISILLRARRADYFEQDESTFDLGVDHILSGTTLIGERRAQSVFDVLYDTVNPYRYTVCFTARQPVPLNALLHHRGRGEGLDFNSPLAAKTREFRNCERILELAKLVAGLRELSVAQWGTEIEPWNSMVEAIRGHWGEPRAALRLAVMAAGVRAHGERCADAPDVFDEAVPLCRRARYARLRAGNSAYWAEQFSKATDQRSALRVALFASTWATPTALMNALGSLESCLNVLRESDWNWVFSTARFGRVSLREGHSLGSDRR